MVNNLGLQCEHHAHTHTCMHCDAHFYLPLPNCQNTSVELALFAVEPAIPATDFDQHLAAGHSAEGVCTMEEIERVCTATQSAEQVGGSGRRGRGGRTWP